MEFSEIAKLNIKKDKSYDSMVLCDLESRLKQDEPKSKEHNKRLGKYNNKKK